MGLTHLRGFVTSFSMKGCVEQVIYVKELSLPASTSCERNWSH